ncbi:hypothetical protein sr17609 [Sporisorium reilianum SRZ2]|uniref:CCHC-type domain-containing protein n=1 Tax=Sporisorium reilianum (strain SRZ2) TaxID=999809 RepID=E7A2B7_SPORE|nr:hypothetical protein sr17609 [Sporisorium reilianum SRZ2]
MQTNTPSDEVAALVAQTAPFASEAAHKRPASALSDFSEGHRHKRAECDDGASTAAEIDLRPTLIQLQELLGSRNTPVSPDRDEMQNGHPVDMIQCEDLTQLFEEASEKGLGTHESEAMTSSNAEDIVIKTEPQSEERGRGGRGASASDHAGTTLPRDESGVVPNEPRPKNKDHAQLRTSIKEQLKQQGMARAQDTSVSFPQNTGKGSYMMLGFDDEQQYELAKKTQLRLGGIECKLIGGCPGWAAQYTVLKSSDHCPRMKQDDLLNLLYETVESVVRPTHILYEVSQTCTMDSEGMVTMGKRKFTGTAWILGKLRCKKTVRDLPAFLLTPGTAAAPLFFQGRGHACASCPTARPSHQTNQCPKLPCPTCKRRGHQAGDCPQSQRSEVDRPKNNEREHWRTSWDEFDLRVYDATEECSRRRRKAYTEWMSMPVPLHCD